MTAVLNNDTKIFILDRSELDGRFDVNYYNQRVDTSGKIKLSKFAKIKGGKRIPLGSDYSNVETDYLYLRVANMDEGNDFNYSDFKFISKDLFNFLSRYELFENELIISIAGTIGKIKLVTNIPENKRVILTENCAKIIFDTNKINPKYFQIVLQTSFVQSQIELSYIQTTIPKLGIDKILNLYLPSFPSIEEQRLIVDRFETAYNQKQQKEAQAKALLQGIDTYILETLGITIPEKQNGIVHRMFTANFSDVVGLRFDPIFFNSTQKSHSDIYENKTLKSICKILKGQSITKEKITEGDYPVIAGGQSSPYNHGSYNYEGNVITISASGAYSGYVWYHNYPIFASDCIVLQSKNEAKQTTQFIYYLLKALQQEIYKLQQGAGQPHVYARDIEKFTIPIPAMPKQIEMLKHIDDLHNQINTLKADAIAVLENAKAEVEKIITG